MSPKTKRKIPKGTGKRYTSTRPRPPVETVRRVRPPEPGQAEKSLRKCIPDVHPPAHPLVLLLPDRRACVPGVGCGRAPKRHACPGAHRSSRADGRDRVLPGLPESWHPPYSGTGIDCQTPLGEGQPGASRHGYGRLGQLVPVEQQRPGHDDML